MISLITLLFYLVTFYGMRYSGFKKLHNNFLSLKILNGLKGLASLSILIGHINLDNQEYAEKKLFQTPPGLGRFYPAFFMFCSGYGLMVSFKKKKNYLNNFLKRRVLTTLIPYLLCRLIGYICDTYITFDSNKSLFYYLNPIIIFKKIILFDHNWFACEIIILYFLFYVLFSFFTNRNINRFIMLLLSWLILFIPTYYSNSEHHIKYIFVRVVYHQAIGSFIYGLLIGDYEEIIIQFIDKYFYIFLILASLFPFYYYFFIKYIRDLPLETGKYLNFWLYVTKYNILSILMYSCVLI